MIKKYFIYYTLFVLSVIFNYSFVSAEMGIVTTPSPIDDSVSCGNFPDDIKLENNNYEEYYTENSEIDESDFVCGEFLFSLEEECNIDYIIKEIERENRVSELFDIYKDVYELCYNKDCKGASIVRNEFGKHYFLKTDISSKEETKKYADKLKIIKGIKSVDLNYISHASDENVVPLDLATNWNMERINLYDALDEVPNVSVDVAVLDSGIYASHSSLVNRIDMPHAYNARTNNRANMYDSLGHGTHVAGIIGADYNSINNVRGVNTNANIIPIKIVKVNDDGEDINDADMLYIERALIYCTENNILICNISYNLREANIGGELRDAFDTYRNAGGLVVLSANNQGCNVDTDSLYLGYSQMDNVIYVANSTNDECNEETLSKLSNFGDPIHIAAPGTNILSTLPVSTANPSGYGYASGTSMAAPHVTGVASLLKAKYPNITAQEIKEAVINGGDYVPKLVGDVKQGGRLNALKALNRPDSTFLEIVPHNNETIKNAIIRALGNRDGNDIIALKISGTGEMANTGSTEASVNSVLPNLMYLDISTYKKPLKDYSFYNCANLVSVTVPRDYNNSYGDGCFRNCTNLSTIMQKFGNNDKTKVFNELDLSKVIDSNMGYAIGSTCFMDCTSIESIKVPNAKDIKVDTSAFDGCSSLGTVYVNTKKKKIGTADLTSFSNFPTYAFYNNGFTRVELPKNVNIGYGAFWRCSLLKEIQINPVQTNNITIGNYAFYSIHNDAKVYVNQDLYMDTSFNIKKSSTANYPKVVNSLVMYPNDGDTLYSTIQRYAYYYSFTNSNINNIVLIGNDDVNLAYASSSQSASIFSNLRYVDLSSFEGSLGGYSFYNCNKLEYVLESDDGIKNVPAYCFANCYNLVGIVKETSEEKLWNEIDLSGIRGSIALDTRAFYQCIIMATVKFPEYNISNRIGIAGAFYNCISLETVYLNNGKHVKGICCLECIGTLWPGWGDNFRNTKVKVVFINSDIDIPERCFYGCEELKDISFDNYVNGSNSSYIPSIGTGAFYYVNEDCKVHINNIALNNNAFKSQLKRTETILIPCDNGSCSDVFIHLHRSSSNNN